MRYIPRDYALYKSFPEHLAEIYLKDSTFLAFAGKSDKARLHIRCRNATEVETEVAKWVAGLDTRQQAKIARREALKNAVTPLKVGDVMVASWGHDQTNVDYFQVVELYGKRGIVLRPIEGIKTKNQGDRGKCIPKLDAFSGAESRHLSDAQGYVKLTSYSYAHPEEFKEVDGARIYRERYWSSYA